MILLKFFFTVLDKCINKDMIFSVERYIGICYPLQSRVFGHRRLIFYLMPVLAFSLLFNLPKVGYFKILGRYQNLYWNYNCFMASLDLDIISHNNYFNVAAAFKCCSIYLFKLILNDWSPIKRYVRLDFCSFLR